MTHKNHPVDDFARVVGPDGQLVDVREPNEVAAGTLPGAKNIPLGELPHRLGELDASRRVVLLCRSGARSTTAAEYLTDSGFGDVVNLAGGIVAYPSRRI
jgi:rhodanese-related sulfurtransferase